jgi:chemotaxis protein methyltransferase CheR
LLTTEVEVDLEIYTQVKYSVRSLLNINLDHYKDEQMRRRLDSWLVRSGAPTWNEYLRRLRTDRKELDRFRDYLTINVSAFFRDPERWIVLRETVLPGLLKEIRSVRSSNGLRVWSAGCSIGAEPYTLAILLDELSPGSQHVLLATDLDRGALVKARRRGPYSSEEIQNLCHAQRARYLEPGGPPFFVQEKLAGKIEFCEHNMLEESCPGDFDLIVCRNVVIYFTGETKDSLYRKFHQALRPGGVLFVGATEILPHPQEIGFRNYGISFYQKV